MIYEITDTTAVSPLFDGWEETLIWSCLQKTMGKIYANSRRNSTAAMAVLGDFTFFAGKPCHELAAPHPTSSARNFRILVSQNEAWKDMLLQVYGSQAHLVSRYATKKEPDIFNRNQLKNAASFLPAGYSICMIDESLYHQCKANAWSADLVSQFPDYETYRRLGLGAAVIKDDAIVSGASSYSRYREGIEIEIDTREDHRQKGLAYACGARLILECLERGLYPSWDAQNRSSLALAEKLGYHYSHTYAAVEAWDA